MKKNLFQFILIGILSLPFGVRAGGAAEGGGDPMIEASTTSEVIQAVQGAQARVVDELLQGTFALIAKETSSSSNLKRALIKGRSSRFVEIVELVGRRSKENGWTYAEYIEFRTKNLSFELQEGSSCNIAKLHFTAKTALDDTHAKICMSLPLLRKIPSMILERQVLGLVAHEYMHTLGFGESDAQIVQKYFLKEVGLDDENLKIELIKNISDLEGVLQRYELSMPSFSSRQICDRLYDLLPRSRLFEETFSRLVSRLRLQQREDLAKINGEYLKTLEGDREIEINRLISVNISLDKYVCQSPMPAVDFLKRWQKILSATQGLYQLIPLIYTPTP